MAVTAATLARVKAARRAISPFAHVVLKSKRVARNGRIVLLAGMSQHIVPTAPHLCTKCGSGEIFQDSTMSSRVYCHGCSSDWFIV